MHPVLFSLGPFKVYSYGLFMALAFLTTLFLVEKKAKTTGIPVAGISNLCLITFVFSILGARAMYVFTNLSYYREEPLEILMLHHGGLMFYGGIIIGLVAALFYLKRSKLPLLPVLDIIALYLTLGQAIGRIGCFLNGCCFGKETNLPWAIKFASQNITRHPTQAYESLGSIIIFIILNLSLSPQEREKGEGGGLVFSLYLILYPINRIIVEQFRADLPKIWMGLSLTQWMSVGILTAGALMLHDVIARNEIPRSSLRTK